MSAGGEHINYKELYEASLQMNQQLLKSNDGLQSQILTLQHQIQQLTKLIKGFKSEKFVPSASDQQQKELGLVFEEAAPSTNLADVQKISYTKIKKPSIEIFDALSNDKARAEYAPYRRLKKGFTHKDS